MSPYGGNTPDCVSKIPPSALYLKILPFRVPVILCKYHCPAHCVDLTSCQVSRNRVHHLDQRPRNLRYFTLLLISRVHTHVGQIWTLVIQAVARTSVHGPQAPYWIHSEPYLTNRFNSPVLPLLLPFPKGPPRMWLDHDQQTAARLKKQQSNNNVVCWSKQASFLEFLQKVSVRSPTTIINQKNP